VTKKTPEDEPQLTSVNVNLRSSGLIQILFDRSVHQVLLPPEQAETLGETLINYAQAARRSQINKGLN
jgi:hypothetical protein